MKNKIRIYLSILVWCVLTQSVWSQTKDIKQKNPYKAWVEIGGKLHGGYLVDIQEEALVLADWKNINEQPGFNIHDIKSIQFRKKKQVRRAFWFGFLGGAVAISILDKDRDCLVFSAPIYGAITAVTAATISSFIGKKVSIDGSMDNAKRKQLERYKLKF